MRTCVGLGACAWVSTFHCLSLADCFCVVIWFLLEEGGRKQACSGLFFHGPLHKHFKIWSCFIYRSSHPHHTVMVTTFRGWKGMMCLHAHGINRLNVCVNIAVMQRTQMECVYRVQYTCWSVSNACQVGTAVRIWSPCGCFTCNVASFFFFSPAVFDRQHSCQACESVCVHLRVFTIFECFPYACACLSLYAHPRYLTDVCRSDFFLTHPIRY